MIAITSKKKKKTKQRSDLIDSREGSRDARRREWEIIERGQPLLVAIMRTVMLALVVSIAVVIGNASMSMAGSKASLLYDPKSPVPDSGKEVLKSQLEFMAVELFSLAVAEVVDVSVEGSM